MKVFEDAKKNFGFGCMRLPMNGKEVDYEQFSQMIAEFFQAGFNYFDTAHGYIGGESERAIKKCLTSKYPRESYVLADKLSNDFFSSHDEIRPFFESQLKACGVDYFDYYLMHAQTEEYYRKYAALGAYEEAFALKAEGKIKHVGMSYHDTAELLDRILTEKPQVEFVQLQFNYIDYDDSTIQSGACYEVCRKHGKPVIVMEPVKGGCLARLPQTAKEVFDNLNGGSCASYAVRYAAGFEGIAMVLSGMSDLDQLRDNISYMKDFKPLSEVERTAVDKVVKILNAADNIPCTACRYCVDGCPKSISIPDLFSCMNAEKKFNDWNSHWYYSVYTQNGGKASDCIKCGKCEHVCPQHLKIRNLLTEVSKVFDN